MWYRLAVLVLLELTRTLQSSDGGLAPPVAPPPPPQTLAQRQRVATQLRQVPTHQLPGLVDKERLFRLFALCTPSMCSAGTASAINGIVR